MDQLSGQLLLALTCVAVAVAVLVRRFVQLIRNPSQSGCGSGGCGGCPAKQVSNKEGFVSLDQFTDRENK